MIEFTSTDLYEKYEPGARFVRFSKMEKWPEEHFDRLGECIEKYNGTDDGWEFCKNLALANGGIWRTPGAVGVKLQGGWSIFSDHEKLAAVRGICDRAAKEQTAAAKLYLREEAKAGFDASPRMVSRKLAQKVLLGKNRLIPLQFYTDIATGLSVCARADLMALKQKIEAKNNGPVTREKLHPVRVTDDKARENLIQTLKHGPVRGQEKLQKAAHVTKTRIVALAEKLIAEGLVTAKKIGRSIEYRLASPRKASPPPPPTPPLPLPGRWRCPTCNYAERESNKVCTQCGTRKIAPRRCGCGWAADDANAKFCGSCGTVLP